LYHIRFLSPLYCSTTLATRAVLPMPAMPTMTMTLCVFSQPKIFWSSGSLPKKCLSFGALSERSTTRSAARFSRMSRTLHSPASFVNRIMSSSERFSLDWAFSSPTDIFRSGLSSPLTVMMVPRMRSLIFWASWMPPMVRK